MAMARGALQTRGAWESLREKLTAIAGAHDVSDGDTFTGRAEYLSAIVSRKSPPRPTRRAAHIRFR
jgi:hypothetical protein